MIVVHTGSQWVYLPQELGFGSGGPASGASPGGTTPACGPAAGGPAGEAAGTRATGLVPGGDRLQPCQGRSANPVDRARSDSKHHILVDGQGITLAVSLTGANRNDITQLVPLLTRFPRSLASPDTHERGPIHRSETAATTTTSTDAPSGPRASNR
ncbi:transposase [Streptomyces sp. NPDC020681]|uniref:transposase n=1 Tax=Streptomyces sp. NPDC020681 TaxID=3365083 RepID=UPI0037A3A48D